MGSPVFFILLKATVPYTLGDISVDTNLYYPLGTYLSDSTYCGEQFLEDASPFYSFDENKVKLFSYDSFGRLIKINNTPFASYDSFGRPVSYNGNILSWYGGNLKSFGNINLYYDLSGRRIKKVNGNKVTHFLYDEQGRLLREKFDGSDVPYITYMYDSSGAVGFMLPYAIYDLGKRHISERPFYYVKDLTGNIRQIVDSNGKCVIKYDYDAWGRVINTEYSDTLYTIWENAYFNAYSIGQLNSLIYKDYYYDKETGLFLVYSRYYDPETGRFISPDSIEYLDPETIDGLNLYSYCLNNPVMYNKESVSFGASKHHITLNYKYTSIHSIEIGDCRRQSNWPKTNSVIMNHYTFSLIENPILSWMFGNFSYTITRQLNSSETFYSFSNFGNDGYSIGVGMNLGNWYGAEVYVSSDGGFGSGWQLTPWLTGSSGWSPENGISISGGIIIGDTTHEITVSVGNGVLSGYALCAVLAATPFPGARIAAAGTACMIFILDLFV